METKPIVVDPFADTALYPAIEAYDEGLLKVSNIHSIAYSVYGNPNGKPVLFVHGGPGGGTDPCKNRQLYYIIAVHCNFLAFHMHQSWLAISIRKFTE